MVNDLNKCLYENFDNDFETALSLLDRDFADEELFSLLENGTVPQKQFAALNIKTVNNIKNAEVLVSNLTGCDGKIREAVASKIYNILSVNPEKRNLFNYPEIFAAATIDINANICRLVIDSIAILRAEKSFIEEYKNKILSFVSEAFNGLDQIIYKDKKYVVNKQLFKLYWCLEALKLFVFDLDEDVLYPILKRCSEEREYTIRERTAQIISLINSDKYSDIKAKLLKDENYYVRVALI